MSTNLHKETASLSDSRVDQPEQIPTSINSHKETASLLDRRMDHPEGTLMSVIPENQAVSSSDGGMNPPEETSMSDTSRREMTMSSSGCKVYQAGSPKHTSSENQPQEGQVVNHPTGPTYEIDDRTVLVYDFVNPKKPAVDSKLVNGFNGTGTPTGLKTPPPTPENSKSKLQERWVHQDEEQVSHSSLLRLLKEYQTADGKVEDSGAQQVLSGLGLPPTLRDSTSRGSSGRSSMTPSLSELEAALSDLLESSASRTGAEEDEEDATPPVQQTLRMMSPKPFSAFSSSFHPVQTSVGSKQLETSA
jgi:hypothetical protein